MSVTHPAGFTAAGVAAGLTSSRAKDVAVLVNSGPSSVAAAVWTTNRCKANPVLWSEQVLKDGTARAVVASPAFERLSTTAATRAEPAPRKRS